VVASYVYDWSAIYSQMIEETAEGTFGDKFYWIEFANDGVRLEYNAAVADEVITEEIRADVDEAIQGFIDGTLDLGDLDAYELEEAEQ
jgi:basic membrane lipoprotein Med (substrate-binding protein (PBP1-ABC) superfamily)